ncbi:HAD family hydrolase [Rathayibacter agropyri]|uniref:HAD family hydrolase n=1 Tax=Rathayibacter agropyri TaxID=1634927 RepID=UPI0015636212|nr:HAD-IB family phosphatase [Rathayibacter agropyri]NRD08981.1 HAD-IB family phosphatase [Rathayibacter agropyri]
MSAVRADWSHRQAAFFDVDETVVSVKSMREFLNYFHDTHGDVPLWDEFVGSLPLNAPRELVNASYYSLWKGLSRREVRVAGQEWFATASRGEGFYIEPVVAEIDELRAKGFEIVLVSGSFDVVLDPLAKELHADRVLCSVMTFVGDTYSGTVARTMIGPAKSDAVLAYCAERRIDPAECIAFGDHPTDLAMLESVGTGVWVREGGRTEFHRSSSRIV